MRRHRRGSGRARLIVLVLAVGIGGLAVAGWLGTRDDSGTSADAPAVADLPAVELDYEGFVAMQPPATEPGQIVFGTSDDSTGSEAASDAAASDGPALLPTPSSATAPSASAAPSTTSAPSTAAPRPGTEGKKGNVTLWLDGWSAQLLGDTTARVSTANLDGAVVRLMPLTAEQIRGALATDADVIAGYLARLYTSASAVTCTAGGCTVNGESVDPGVLADPAATPGLGAVYAGAGITHGLYAARLYLADPKESLEVRIGDAGTILRSGDLVEGDTVVDRPTGPQTGYDRSSWPLAAGLGRMFVNEPAWISAKPVRYFTDLNFVTDQPKGLDGAYVGPILVGAVSDPAMAPMARSLTPSQMTYFTSPTTGCGVTVLCIAQEVTPEIADVKNTATTACFLKPQDGPQGRVVLLAQSAKVTVDLPGPAILRGYTDLVEGPGVIGLDMAKAVPSTGKASFTQQAVFALDDSGIKDISGVRNQPPMTFTSAFGGAFVSCSE